MHALERADLARVALVLVAIAASWMMAGGSPVVRAVAGLVGVALGGYPVLREALAALAKRRMTMELSMTIAIVAALAIREFSTALVILLFVLVVEILEHLTVARGRRSIRSLLDHLPARTLLRDADGLREVSVAALSPGAIVVVRPGEQVPVDGVVCAGYSAIDESSITGEGMPAEKAPGARVFAGTLNQAGAIDVSVERIGENTAFGRIVHLVEQAEQSKAPAQKLADRIAGWLVAFTLVCATLTLLLTHDARSTIAVVIVAGACGIAAGTPLAILGAVGRAAREGVVIKGGRALEALSSLDAVVLDKTGTVTLGVPTVTEVRPCARATAQEVIAAAASAERLSEHPVARAVLTKAAEDGITVTEPETFEAIAGQGVVARVCDETVLVGRPPFVCERLAGQSVNPPPVVEDVATEILVARAGRLLGTIYIRDVVRPESREAVGRLQNLGLQVALVTGDHRSSAEAVANALGVDKVASDMLPADKAAWVESELAGGRKSVAMVGDGVNDAPALRRATVGIAMGTGSDVARECADVLLIGSDLTRLVRAIEIATRCRRIVLTNVVGTLAVDAVGIGLAAFGLLPPSAAALVHVVSELAFILNAARLLPAPQIRAQGTVSERTVAEKSLDRAGQVA